MAGNLKIMNTKRIVIYLFIYIFIFFIGAFFGAYMANKKIEINEESIYSECWEDARDQLVGICKPATNMDDNAAVTNFYGKLLTTNQGEKQIVIDPAPLDDGSDVDSLLVNIDNNTKIDQVVRKDEAEYQEELNIFNKEYQSDKNAVYPLPFRNEEVDITAFRSGQNVTIVSNEDVRNAKSVSAEKIIINFNN